MLICVAISLLLLQAEATPNVFQYEISKAKDFVQSFDRQKEKGDLPSRGPGKLQSFSWQDCSSSAPLVNIKSLGVGPDPLQFPGDLIVTADFNIKKKLDKPLKVQLEIKKKEAGFFIKIPCIDNFGSCTYDDICTMIAGAGSQCPQELKQIGIDCTCPFKKNEYHLPKVTFNIEASIIPSGEYQVQANVTQGGSEVICLKAEFSIE